MKKIVLGFLMLGLSICSAKADEILLWMYNDQDIYDWADGNTYKADTLVGRGAAADKKVNAVRISTTGSDGETVYLDLIDPFADNVRTEFVAMPTEWGSDKVYWAGPAYASLSGLDLTDTSRTFAMEIGYAMFDDSQTLTEWIVMAAGTETYQNLRERWIVSDELSMEATTGWSPSMNVPEPNSGMLMLIGGMLLALKRKNRV